jgi:hypothetical protein
MLQPALSRAKLSLQLALGHVCRSIVTPSHHPSCANQSAKAKAPCPVLQLQAPRAISATIRRAFVCAACIVALHGTPGAGPGDHEHSTGGLNTVVLPICHFLEFKYFYSSVNFPTGTNKKRAEKNFQFTGRRGHPSSRDPAGCRGPCLHQVLASSFYTVEDMS